MIHGYLQIQTFTLRLRQVHFSPIKSDIFVDKASFTIYMITLITA